MLQTGTVIKVVDNTGARFAQCIKVLGGFKRRYAKIGDKLVLSIKSLRTRKRSQAKVTKGKIVLGLVIYIKQPTNSLSSIYRSFNENGVVLITEQGKPLGSRILGGIPKTLRFSKYMRLASMGSGLIK